MISWAEDFVTVFGPDLSIRGCVGGVVKNRTISTIWIGKKSIRLTNNPWKRTWNWIGLPKMCGLPNMHKDLRLMLWKPFLHSTYTKLWWAGTSNLKNIFEERKYHGIHSGGMWFTIRQDTSAILGPLATHTHNNILYILLTVSSKCNSYAEITISHYHKQMGKATELYLAVPVLFGLLFFCSFLPTPPPPPWLFSPYKYQ